MALNATASNEQPHPDNVPGPFYVVNDCCTSCGVPQDAAPDLFSDLDEAEHCFVKRQPKTPEELFQMIRALWASELGCVKYRGQDPDILRRLGELGAADYSDETLPPEVKPILRNHVTFHSADPSHRDVTPANLAQAFQGYLYETNRQYDRYRCRITESGRLSARLQFTWTSLIDGIDTTWYPVEFIALRTDEARLLIRHSEAWTLGSISVSLTIHDWLTDQPHFDSVRWYTADQWSRRLDYFDTPI